MALIREWSASSYGSDSTSETITGTATLAGNTLFLDIFVRGASVTPVVTVTDSGGVNDWELVTSYDGGNTDLYMFICRDAAPITSVTASWVVDDTPTSLPHMIFMGEYSDVGPAVGSPVVAAVSGGELPATIPMQPGQLYRALGGTSTTSRTWTLTSTGAIVPTAREEMGTQQMQIKRADGYATEASDVAVGWLLGEGTATTFVNIGAAYDAPQSLSVDVGEDASAYVGVPIGVEAQAAGGSGVKTYAWTTDGSGTFGDATAAATTYTATEAGEHVLTCTVSDSSGEEEDSLVLTATEIPTEDFAGATGWTTVVGSSRLAAISDDDDGTYVQTDDDPDGEVLTLTLPAMGRPVGDLTVPLRLSAQNGTVSVVPTLTVLDAGPTPRTVTADTISVTGSVTSYVAVFDAADLADTINWDTGLTITLTATAV